MKTVIRTEQKSLCIKIEEKLMKEEVSGKHAM